MEQQQQQPMSKKIGSKDIELGSLDSDIEIERWKWREGETVT